MGLPSTLLDLHLQLRADSDAARRRHVATLASRLGYKSVWFSAGSGGGSDRDTLAEIDSLLAAGVIQVGAVFTGSAAEVPAWLGAVARDRPGLLVDVPGAASADYATALGDDEWRRRGYVRDVRDPAAAGVVLSSANWAETLLLVAEAARARTTDSPGQRIGVALGVSIGRTMSEAKARVERDPFLAATGVTEAGLFGTVEQVQEQVLALAAAGTDWIRADLADERDIADLLAHLRAALVGPALVLRGRER